MVQYLFGPVPSRRLGMSLGVDLVPRKVCSLDCVYCEVGATTKCTLTRMPYVPFESLAAELNHFLAHNPDPDYITFSGSGEPTLNNRIGDVIQLIRSLRPAIPSAVLTNGTVLADETIRKALLPADVVLPSLDAATETVFQKINRPAKGLSIQAVIEGLVRFSREFVGFVWLEVFILPGYNDHEEELMAIREAIRRIDPIKVQLNTLDRPGVLPGLRGATREELDHIIELWDLPRVEIIAKVAERKEIQSYRNDVETTILGTIARRPCTVEDLAKILGKHPAEVNKYLDVLEADGKVKAEREERGIFYRTIE